MLTSFRNSSLPGFTSGSNSHLRSILTSWAITTPRRAACLAHGAIVPPAQVHGQTFEHTTSGTPVTFGKTLGNSQPFPVTERDLNIILAPGDITYKIFGKPLELYWDFAYNSSGDDRFNGDYGPLYSSYFYVGTSSTPSFRITKTRCARMTTPTSLKFKFR